MQRRALILPGLSILLLTSTSLAQVHPRVTDFIPPGWEIEYSLTSDLTGDGVPDVAIILVERVDDDTYGSTYRNRRLIVLKRTAADYELIGSNDSALWSAYPEGGTFFVTKGDSNAINLKSNRSKLILHEYMTNNIQIFSDDFIFRYDAKQNRMRLIGHDMYCFAPHVEFDVSTNYLTGNSMKSTIDKKGREHPQKSRAIPLNIVWMEEVTRDQD